jgi:Tol biopolymer transport system component
VLFFIMVALAGGLEADTSQGASASPAAVVFNRGGDLYAVALDGSRTVRLTRTHPAEEAPAVSQDGRMIAFTRAGGISTMRVDGSRRRIVTRGADSSPAWAPDGRTIYFVRYRDNRFGASCGSIFAVSATGQNLRRVTDAFANDSVHGETDEDPAVSPDGRRIAFSDWDACEGGTASPRLRVVDPAGRPTQDLAKLRNNGYFPDPAHYSPAWSPDGNRLAFFKYSDLKIANRDGSSERLVVRGQGVLIYEPPAWSPDGRWIAFTKHPSARSLLLVVHPDGTGLRRLAQTRSGGYSLGGWLPRLPQ